MMNHLLPVLLVFLMVPAGADELRGRIYFTNGDRLTGLPERPNEEGDLVLQPGDLLRESATLPFDKLLELRIDGAGAPKVEASHEATVRLTNGDSIRGQLTGLDEGHVTLETWYGGELRLKRSMCSELEVEPIGKLIYSGPDALEHWKRSGEKDSWGLELGQLSSKGIGGVAREIEFPDKYHLEFKLAWQTTLKFRLILSSDDGATLTPGNCYELIGQRRFLYLRKRWSTLERDYTQTIGQPVNIRDLVEKSGVHMELFVDRKAGSLALYVDGVQAQVWGDEDSGVGDFGNWIHFNSEEYPLRISGIRAAVWKGALPDDADALDEEGGKIRLVDGTEVIGDLGEIRDGQLIVTKEGVETKIPIEKFSAIPLAGEYEEPRRKKRDIRCWHHDGGSITFELTSIEGQSLVGVSQVFGEVRFDLKAFTRIEFNIYDEELEKMRSGHKW